MNTSLSANAFSLQGVCKTFSYFKLDGLNLSLPQGQIMGLVGPNGDAGCSILLTTHYLEEAEMLADRVVVLSKGRIVASGTVSDVRSIVSRRHIRCDSALPADQLSHWPGVIAVSRVEQRLTILATDAERVLRQLLASDLAVANIEVQQAGLAEAFIELTKEAA
jgi:ABC-type uncharacterized transport system ATPase subunit